MTIERIVHYVLHTPHNTNKAILISMLKELIKTNCNCSDCPANPDDEKEITYDGGNESTSGGDADQDGTNDFIYDGGMET